MPLPGKYVVTSLGLAGIKAIVYPKLQGKPIPVSNSGKDFPPQDIEITNRMSVGGDDAEILSWLGTPVFADLRLKADPNESDDDSLYMETVLITVSQEKNIIKTPVNGRNGTVKEYFSDGDFSITFEGAIVGRDPYAYPESPVKNLIRLMRQPNSIVAISPFLQLFGIYEIAVEDFDLNQIEGFQNMQRFMIHASSDLPIELVNVEDDF
jgi:hypothetical protein